MAQTITVHHGALAIVVSINALRASEAAGVRIEDYAETLRGHRVLHLVGRAGCEPAECSKSRKIDMSDCSKIRYASRGDAVAAMRVIARRDRKHDRVCPGARFTPHSVLLGLLVLHQTPAAIHIVGITLVVCAGAAAQRRGLRDPETEEGTDLEPELLTSR